MIESKKTPVNMSKRIICYPLKPNRGSRWGNNELRHSLRSVEMFWKGKYDEVVILSDRMPDWIDRDEVTFVEAPKYVSALYAAVNYAGEGGDILWMNDDILFMHDCEWEDLVNPMHYMGKMGPDKAEELSKEAGNMWKRRLGKIMVDLHDRGLPTYKFSTHTPYWYQADKLKVMLDRYAHLGYKVAIENAYFNTYFDELGGGKNFKDKFRAEKGNLMIPLETQHTFKFLNLTDGGLKLWMKGFVRGRFPDKSRFEL